MGLPIIIDAGGRGYQTFKPYQNDLTSFDRIGDFQAYFVMEPGLELNLIKLIRPGVGASYRYTTDINLPGAPTNALRGFNAGLSLKIGKFYNHLDIENDLKCAPQFSPPAGCNIRRTIRMGLS